MWIFTRLPNDGSAAMYIHRCIQREVWSKEVLGDRIIMRAALPFVPFILAVLVAAFTAINGPAIKKRTGKGLIRQIREQIGLAVRFAIPPPWYYIFELHDDDRKLHAGEYLNRLETKGGLYRFLRDNNGGLPVPAERSTGSIKDKMRFRVRCREHGIATAPVFFYIAQEKITAVDWGSSEPSALPELPECDLFIKPVHGQGGKKATRWEYIGSGNFRRNDGGVATGSEVLERLRHASRHGAFLVQPRLASHHEIADLANGTLSTVRVMTCRNEKEGVEVTNAAFRMARNKLVVVDNFHAGGIAANVDISTGTLGRGTRGAWGVTADGWYEQHPETGIQILNRKLPCWVELVDLVQYAHGAAFFDQVVIGWDVALLDSGPCIMEANKAPDLDIIQRVEGVPLGNQRLGRLLAFNLMRTVEAQQALAVGVRKSTDQPSGITDL